MDNPTRIGALATALLFVSAPVVAQSITTEALAPVPIGSPWLLLVLGLTLIGGMYWSLRTGRGLGPRLSMLAVGLLGAGLWLAASLGAQISSSFADPAGGTLAIPVTQTTSGSDVSGFEAADFTNTSGATLRITAIDAPTFSECFAGGLTGQLLPAGAPDPSPPTACAVDDTLAAGATCRVNVETICRAAASGNLATLTAIAPASGTTLGGTVVTLTGTNLTGATGVTFGGTAATAVTVVNATTVTATTPANAAGTVDVVVSTSAGGPTLDDGFTYVTPAPTFTAINPTSGTTLGGTAVTLTGTNLTGATGVAFDGVAATGVTVVNATTVTATAPAHAAGAVDVAITTPGWSATLAGGYTYVLLPTLTAVNANSGTAAGFTGITLTGTTLTGATGVTFDGVAATFVNVVSSTTVTAVTPAHAAGATDVVITTPGGSATLSNGFTYVATAVGQSSGGGGIAALNGGLNNLIAATADNSAGIVWGGTGIAVGAAAQSNTDGAANTTAIVTALGNNGGIPYAAQVCSNYEVDSQGNTPCQAGNACYSDWFLPAGNNLTATGQLNALFTNRVAIGGFANGTYRSSTETAANPSNEALVHNFFSGVQGNFAKGASLRVRCVRAFTP